MATATDRGTTDVAALAASSAAAAISLAAGAGPYELLSFLTSVSLASIIWAYIWPHNRTRAESAAFAAGVALVMIPAMGFIIESIAKCAGWPIPDDNDTRVTDLWLFLCWGAVFCLVVGLDRKKQNRNTP